MTAKEAYIKTLNEIAQRYGSLEDTTVRRAIGMLRQLRAQIADQMLLAGGWDAYRLRELQRNVERLIAEYQARLGAELRAAFVQTCRDGALSVVEPLNALGMQGAFFQPTPQLVNVLLDYSAELVTNITDQMRNGINVQIRLAALGQKSPMDAMRAVADVLGVQARARAWARRPPVTKGVAARAERIVRTEMQRAFNLAHHSQQLATAKNIPGLLKAWVATADSRTRDSHLLAHMQYRKDPIPVDQPYVLTDPELGRAELMMPGDPAAPIGFTVNCVLPGNNVLAPDIIAASRARYEGPAIRLRISSGQEITVTPNHPILTPSGFVAAKFICKGDDIIRSRASQLVSEALYHDDDHVPTAIEEKWRSLSIERVDVLPATSRATSQDFHGDARFFDGDIDIVRADCLLQCQIDDTSLNEQIAQDEFGRSRLRELVLLGDGASAQLAVAALHTADGIMSGLCQLASGLWRHLLHADCVRFAYATSGDSMFNEPTAKNVSGNAHLFGESLLSLAGLVPDNVRRQLVDLNTPSLAALRAAGTPLFRRFFAGGNSMCFRQRSELHAHSDESAANGRIRYVQLARNFLQRFAGLVKIDQVTDISRFTHNGHVYDLQCMSGLYICNDIPVKNCRCTQNTIHPQIGLIGSSLDGRIAAEWQRREKERQNKAQRRPGAREATAYA